MPEKNDSIEAAVQREIDQNQGFADSDHQWVETEESYGKAQKIVGYLLSLKESISADQSKVLLSAQEFIKNYENSVEKVRDSIAAKKSAE